MQDKCFHVSEVYLKKEERIEALCMIMVLSLLIYSFAEWRLRERLKETGQTIPNQLSQIAAAHPAAELRGIKGAAASR